VKRAARQKLGKLGQAFKYRDRDVVRARSRPRAAGDSFEFPMLSSQFHGQRAAELLPEQRLAWAMLAQAVDDWRSLHELGHFADDHIRASRIETVYEEAITLRGYLFDDEHAKGEPDFITARQACLSLSIDLNQLRAGLRTIGAPEQLHLLPVFARHKQARPPKKSHAVADIAA